ncbi:peptidoglycan DD-metalloendopeptidase family protein [Erysipelothrix sp. HDW6C]|uniref:murein hydrolase activator EnvC family protein n=1 Tax=Erysipelothrix sp. HDW6C TaxID=2714930 RepID=UPI00140C63CC|nr:peptidoglycan DD-metalloendopeptidase family protein [Erysipelothrix sp. HDW6C]QIK68882.1 peptidoglycan DD-metalloendopeptidase family protein [Erysipelothrix sp. HDW6C]
MRHRFQSTFKLLLVTVLFLAVTSPIGAISDAEFASNEAYYNELCRGVSTADTVETCKAYREYLNRKIADQSAEKEDLAAQRKSIESDLANNLNLIDEYVAKIKSFEDEAANLQAQIDAKEIEIERLEGLVAERMESIKVLEEDVKTYMVNSQSTMRVNGYIEFIMGARDFADIIRRIDGMNAIKRYNETVISDLRTEREKLVEDQNLVAAEKFDIENAKVEIEAQGEKAKLYEAGLQTIYSELKEQQGLLDVADAKIEAEISANVLSPQDIVDFTPPPDPEPEPGEEGGETPTNPGNGVTSIPVFGARLTETVWDYTWGGTHLGSDMATGIGTPIHAMGDGIVVVATGGCSTNGSFNCNGGLGNHMATIYVGGDGNIYGSLIMHMAQDSFTVGAGSRIRPGQQVGQVGNSGASYGAHAHVEVFYLGKNNTTDGGLPGALERWNSSQRTAQFGLGGSSGGKSSLCSNKGDAIPCRVNPESHVH